MEGKFNFLVAHKWALIKAQMIRFKNGEWMTAYLTDFGHVDLDKYKNNYSLEDMKLDEWEVGGVAY